MRRILRSRRRRVWLAATVLLIYASLNFVAFLLAGTQGTQCAPSDTANVRLWENEIGDDTDGNDSVWLCGSSYSNLAGISHTLPGGCHDGGFGHEHWGDCASSIGMEIPSGQKLCMYPGAGYGGTATVKQGPQTGFRYNVPSDVISSLRITSGSC